MFRRLAFTTVSNVMDGVFAIRKPTSITSAQVIRDLQSHFNRSAFFAPWLAAEKARVDAARSSSNQHGRFYGRRKQRSKQVQVKLGHGGTLDPLATGVLIVGVGNGTKALGSFLQCTKAYDTVVVFGTATDSYDRTGKIVARDTRKDSGGKIGVMRAEVEEALQRFRGDILQAPSIFSALKVQGKKMYEYAREGLAPPREIQPRPVTVHELEMVEWWEPGEHEFLLPTEEAEAQVKEAAVAILGAAEGIEPPESDLSDAEKTDPTASERNDLKRKADEDVDETPLTSPKAPKTQRISTSTASSHVLPTQPKDRTLTSIPITPTRIASEAPACRLRMTVTSGFYVRSLCHDLGKAVGSYGTMSELERTRQGDFELGNGEDEGNTLDYRDLEGGEEVWGPKLRRSLEQWEESARRREAQSEEGTGAAAEEGVEEGVENGVEEGVDNEVEEGVEEGGPTAAATLGQGAGPA